MRKNHPKLAFSLIELSIVILVIGILVIGITKGSRIIKEAKLKSARALTLSSPVASIGNLVMWLESTSEKSFVSGQAVDTALGVVGTIATWNDINPQTSTPNNATQGTTNNKPRYFAGGINGLPVVNFDGASDPNADYMSFNGSGITNSNYTVIVVESRRSSVATNYFIAGSGSIDNQNLHLGYRTNTNITFAQHGNDCDATTSAYSSPTPIIHSFTFNSSNGKKYYANGVLKSFNIGACASPNTGLSSGYIAQIGKFNTYSGYNGDIGEIIMFNKTLSSNELSSVVNYLKTKWGIK